MLKHFAVAGIAAGVLLGAADPAGAANTSEVKHTTGKVNGFKSDIWTWYDSNKKKRTVALKKEGGGNKGHGGYAVQMTYYAKVGTGPTPTWRHVIVNPASGGDGGFGYFVSHERYRLFSDSDVDTIASKIFGVDDSPLGLGFAATASIPSEPKKVGIERFTIQYGHYGTLVAHPVDPETGFESTPLPLGKSNYKFYTIPVTTSWVFEAGYDYPRIDISVDVSQVIPSGSTPKVDLVSFDVRGPYGVMVFDDGNSGEIETAMWGDQAYLFTTQASPVTRSTAWTWSAANTGARYNAITASGYEMGLYEPVNVSSSATVDGYANERGFISANFNGTSNDSCASGDAQTLPSDGTWPYQSVQYSLPCPPPAHFLTQPTDGQKIAWGSTSYIGTSLAEVYNGQSSFPFNGWPSNHKFNYSVCIVTAWQTTNTPVTAALAGAYTPTPAKSDCATAS